MQAARRIKEERDGGRALYALGRREKAAQFVVGAA